MLFFCCSVKMIVDVSSLCSESVEKNVTESTSSSQVTTLLRTSSLVLEVSSESWLEEFDRDYGSLSGVFGALE